MGESYALDGLSTERLATRIPLSEKVAADLAFQLECTALRRGSPLKERPSAPIALNTSRGKSRFLLNCRPACGAGKRVGVNPSGGRR